MDLENLGIHFLGLQCYPQQVIIPVLFFSYNFLHSP